MDEKKQLTAALRTVLFPGIDRDIVTLGYVKDVSLIDGRWTVRVDLSPRAAGAANEIESRVRDALESTGIASALDLRVAAAPASPSEPAPPPMPSDPLAGVRYKIAVASGKGGVGKSTVAVNLAVAMARLGRSTGLLDADVYGPSAPIMFGREDDRPRVRDQQLVPIEAHGVRTMSIGYMIERGTPVIWRGPMVSKALDQMMGDVDWSGVEVLIFDLPPGTGDVQISLAQKTSLTGAVIVSTPQDVALIDAAKAVAMFSKVQVPILGLIENMSYFACPSCGHRAEIFRHGGAAREAARLDVPFLGEIPLDPDVVMGGDQGRPIVERKAESPASLAFFELARRLLASLDER